MMRTFLLLFLSVYCWACGNNKGESSVVAEPPPPPPKYYFYPRANVYFDSVNKDYVYMGNDGKVWQAEKQIPAAMQALMDKNIFIDTPSNPVWKDNENHKLVYSALLYALPSDTQAVKEIAPPIKQAPKVIKKEKKGLRKFFDKIFGKKKKDVASN